MHVRLSERGRHLHPSFPIGPGSQLRPAGPAVTTDVPAPLRQEFETIAARAAEGGRPLLPVPTLEIATHDKQTSRAFTGPAGSTDAPRVRLARDLLDTSSEDRAWTIAHELSHVLRAQEGSRSEYTHARLTAMGALLALSVGALVFAGYAGLVGAGPNVGLLFVLALLSGVAMCVAAFEVIRREETAADATAAEVFGEVLTVAGVERLRRKEGAFAELPLAALRTHPRPSDRRRAGLKFHVTDG